MNGKTLAATDRDCPPRRYRIICQLGQGGFGAVYEAHDDDIGKSFALKETFYAANEELRQAFRREARMLASLEHDAFPNVSHYSLRNRFWRGPIKFSMPSKTCTRAASSTATSNLRI